MVLKWRIRIRAYISTALQKAKNYIFAYQNEE